MWKILPYTKPLYISSTMGIVHQIHITDYVNMWWVHYSEKDFLRLLKKSNDDLEMESDEQLLQLGFKMLLHPEELKKLNISFEHEILNISMVLSCGFPVYLDMKLIKGTAEMFFRIVTQTLLKTVCDLKKSEDELRFLLLKKDKEIEEYKNETDVRLAMYLKTGVFRDEEHMGKHPMYKNYFGSLEIPKCLLQNTTEATDNQIILSDKNLLVKEQKVKIEPDSQRSIKNDPDVPENETHNLPNSETIIREIKSEPHNISPKKKPRQWLKI